MKDDYLKQEIMTLQKEKILEGKKLHIWYIEDIIIQSIRGYKKVESE